MHEPDHLRVAERDGAVIVGFLESKIHEEMAISSLGEELQAVIAQPDCRKLILNFSGVELVTSAMLGKLVSTNRRMDEKGGTMILCEMGDNLRYVFRITKLDNILKICETEADALAR
jgi:anti-anti-sigma factor